MGSAQRYFYCLVIICIALAGVSPACHFVSGKTGFIEICKADGSVETIEVSAEFDPFSDPDAPPPMNMAAMDDCVFCGFQADLGTHKFEALRFDHGRIAKDAIERFGHTSPFVYFVSLKIAQAPPVSFV